MGLAGHGCSEGPSALDLAKPPVNWAQPLKKPVRALLNQQARFSGGVENTVPLTGVAAIFFFFPCETEMMTGPDQLYSEHTISIWPAGPVGPFSSH